jgi:hypothetical protein
MDWLATCNLGIFMTSSRSSDAAMGFPMLIWNGSRPQQFQADPFLSAMTNARFARLHGLPVGPIPFTTPPDPPRKSRARHGRH